MLDKIKSVDSELLLDNGIFAVDKENPNNIVGLNSAGWFISTDGGATAEMVATAEGLVANSIKTGDLMTHLVRVVGTEGLFYIDGDTFKAIDPNNPNKYTEITPQGAYFKEGSITIETTSGRKVIMDGWLNRSQTITPRMPAFQSSAIENNEPNWYSTRSTVYETAHSDYFIHEARYLVCSMGLNQWGYSTVADGMMETTNGQQSNVHSTAGLGAGASHYDWLIIDLGEPLETPTSREVHYKFKSRNADNPIRMHLGNRFLTDNPPVG